jgi:hypothetical protein
MIGLDHIDLLSENQRGNFFSVPIPRTAAANLEELT